MITYFPTPYPDESFYSVFARYAVGEGLYSVRYCNEKLHCKQTYTDMNYMNDIAPEVKRLLTRDKDWKTVIKEHTIYNYMTSFLPADQKERALEYLAQGDELYRKIIPPFPKYEGVTNHIKYCPICVKEDREKYGEAYWHREWMIPEIRACYKHHCYLCESAESVSIIGKHSLYDAESNISITSKIIKSDPVSDKLAAYVYEAMNQEYTLKISLENILLQILGETGYLSKTGGKINRKKLWNEMSFFYINRETVTECRLTKILHEKRYYPYDIIQILAFLNIPLLRVYAMQIERDPYKEFQEKVASLYQQGIGMSEISRIVNVPLEAVRYAYNVYIAEQNGEKPLHYQTYQPCPVNHKSRKAVKDAIAQEYFEKIDKILPRINFFDDSTKRICKAIIFEKLEQYGIKIDTNKLKYMPKCDMLIRSYCESYEHSWARKICEAVNEIEEKQLSMSIGRIVKMTSVPKKNIIRSMEEIKERDEKVWEQLNLILN